MVNLLTAGIGSVIWGTYGNGLKRGCYGTFMQQWNQANKAFLTYCQNEQAKAKCVDTSIINNFLMNPRIPLCWWWNIHQKGDGSFIVKQEFFHTFFVSSLFVKINYAKEYNIAVKAYCCYFQSCRNIFIAVRHSVWQSERLCQTGQSSIGPETCNKCKKEKSAPLK